MCSSTSQPRASSTISSLGAAVPGVAERRPRRCRSGMPGTRGTAARATAWPTVIRQPRPSMTSPAWISRTRGAGGAAAAARRAPRKTSMLLWCSMRARMSGPYTPSSPKSCDGHPRDRRRPVDVEIGNAIRALIPPLQHQPRVVEAVVVVQMAEERVRHLDGAPAGLEQPMVRAGTVIEHDHVAADVEQIAGALAGQRRRGRAGAEQGQFHGSSSGRSRRLVRSGSRRFRARPAST